MNKRQRIAAWIVGWSIFIIFFKIRDLELAVKMSISWVIVGGLLTYLLRDKAQ